MNSSRRDRSLFNINQQTSRGIHFINSNSYQQDKISRVYSNVMATNRQNYLAVKMFFLTQVNRNQIGLDLTYDMMGR